MVLFKTLLAVLLTAGLAEAQSQSGNIRDSVMTPTIGGQLSILEQFLNQLRLDTKTQIPAVDEILTADGLEAAPVAQEMQQLRLQLVNAELRNLPDEQKALAASYAEAAAKMAAIETKTFAKILAILRPNQMSRAPEAFAIMAGIYLPQPPPAGRRGGGSGGRGGGR